MTTVCDIAIVGGGFSGLATLANIVKKTEQPLSIAVLSRDPPDVFGPAYSTPRPEHLLNVRASGMGLFDDNHRGFHDWAAAADKSISPHAYLPRRLFAEYLKSVRRETLKLAKDKGITLRFIQTEVEDIIPAGQAFRIGGVTAGTVVLAIGNSLKAKEEPTPGVIGDPWNFDYAEFARSGIKKVALIGSGLTALDALMSLLTCGWQGKMTCFSGNGLLPQPQPVEYDAAKMHSADRADYIGKPLSHITANLLRAAKVRGADWPYAVDSLRPLTQDLWKSLSLRDRQRLAGKYFGLWNVHRHRCAAEIRQQTDAAISSGMLTMIKARCNAARAVEEGVELELQRGAQRYTETFDLAFKCTGVSYGISANPLLTMLLGRGLLRDAGNPYGIAADEHFRAYAGPEGVIYAIGTPLFGQLFETTAVPELRHQAARVAAHVISERLNPSQSRAAGAGESLGAPPEASATGGS